MQSRQSSVKLTISVDTNNTLALANLPCGVSSTGVCVWSLAVVQLMEWSLLQLLTTDDSDEQHQTDGQSMQHRVGVQWDFEAMNSSCSEHVCDPTACTFNSPAVSVCVLESNGFFVASVSFVTNVMNVVNERV